MKRNPDYVLREIAGETVLVPVSGDFNGIIALNEIGAEIYRRIDECPTAEQLTDALCELYDAPRQVIAEDTAAFLRQMKEENIIL